MYKALLFYDVVEKKKTIVKKSIPVFWLAPPPRLRRADTSGPCAPSPRPSAPPSGPLDMPIITLHHQSAAPFQVSCAQHKRYNLTEVSHEGRRFPV